ncbi:MAG: WYL domain-containing protein [Gemmatimonadetes bacterium]|nr:WYL domain-containing protein [Gemmatimonadota bacterium]MBA4157042.1 WYL domain-containing protein [Gemmatimonadota bacterium]
MEHVPADAERWRSEDAKARASVRRTFERDKEELRRLGIPLETVEYSVHFGGEALDGYRITRRDLYVPYLRLLSEGRSPTIPSPVAGAVDPGRVAEVELRLEDAQLAIDALSHVSELSAIPMAAAARSARRKLGFDLGVERSPLPGVPLADRPGVEEVLQRMRVLSDALLGRKRVRFRYHGIRRGETTQRDVAPYGLFFRCDWYLIGHDALRDAVRVFRVARMASVEPNRSTPCTPDYEIPPDFHLEEYLGREAWELGEPSEAPVPADVLFHFPTALRAERNGYGTLAETRSDGAAVRRFAVHQIHPFLRWILSLDGEVEILGPPGLQAELHGVAAAVAALPGGQGSADG